MATHDFGPDNASLIVRTFREGVGAGAGHDLVLAVTKWRAVADLEGEPADWHIALDADPGSFEVREAHGGLRPLTDADAAEVARNIDRKILRRQPIAFRSTRLRRPEPDEPIEVRGHLTLAGHTGVVELHLELAPDGRLTATVPLLQSHWGITPFKALMGALRVRDEVVVTVEARQRG
jgi:YceI-like domain